jgi:hypothetical protein
MKREWIKASLFEKFQGPARKEAFGEGSNENSGRDCNRASTCDDGNKSGTKIIGQGMSQNIPMLIAQDYTRQMN